MLQALLKNNIRDVIFVGGFHQEIVESYVQKEFPEINAQWVRNELFGETNTQYSVWLTKKLCLTADDDILLLNGDVVLDSRVIARTVEAEGTNVLATRFDRVDEEEVKVKLNGDRKITEIGKHLVPSESAGESVGINRLSRGLLPRFFETAAKRINNGDGRSEYYEHAFNELIQNGEDFRTADVTDLPVMEVDTPEDYDVVQKRCAIELQS